MASKHLSGLILETHYSFQDFPVEPGIFQIVFRNSVWLPNQRASLSDSLEQLGIRACQTRPFRCFVSAQRNASEHVVEVCLSLQYMMCNSG